MFFDAIADAIMDSLKLIPFLFCTYIILEYMESKMNGKTIDLIQKSGQFGPVIGAVLGLIPQCGFSAAATNLYAGRVITVGTLLAVYLSTSDEMIPILIVGAIPLSTIAFLLILKAVAGILVGTLLDWCLRENHGNQNKIAKTYDRKKGNEKQGIIKAAISHTVHIVCYIVFFSFAFNVLIVLIGEETLSNVIWNQPFISELLAGVVGLVPNCAASVLLTKLYVDGAIGIGSLISGLLVGAGVGIMVLFRVNNNLKENFKIVGILYGSGVLIGCFVRLFLILCR